MSSETKENVKTKENMEIRLFVPEIWKPKSQNLPTRP
jgi:hypothetical protein